MPEDIAATLDSPRTTRKARGEGEDIAALHPEYWQQSGKQFQLRPNSAPTSRPASIPVPPLPLGLLVPSPPPRAVHGAVEMSKCTPRRPSDVVPVSPRHHSLDEGRDAFAQASAQITPRTRGFSMSSAPGRQLTSGATAAPIQATNAPIPSVPSLHVPTTRFASMVGRQQASYARGITTVGPTAAYFRGRLAESAAPCQSARDAEEYLETFVDDEDLHTVGVRGATQRRARVVMRKRSYEPSAWLFGTVQSSLSAKGTVPMEKFSGRSPVVRTFIAKRQSEEPTPPPVAAAHSSNPEAAYLPQPVHVPGVCMERTTGRTAPVSTVLSTPAAVVQACHQPDGTVDAMQKHVRGVNMSKSRPHSLHPASPRQPAASQAYRVKDDIVWRKAPSAIM